MRFRLVAVAAVLLAAAALAALLVTGAVSLPAVETFRRYGYLGAFLLLYIEESGVPLLVPGDAFVIYVGHRLPADPLPWAAAWLGMTLAVTLGATNLYLLSRWLGRRLLEHPLARFLHLSPERLDAAEHRFRRWGPWAVLIGRHVPGMRVPITVACGVLRMPYRVFAPCVAISTAIWAAFFLTIGATFGDEVVHLLGSTSVRVALLALAAAGIALLVVVRLAHARGKA